MFWEGNGGGLSLLVPMQKIRNCERKKGENKKFERMFEMR